MVYEPPLADRAWYRSPGDDLVDEEPGRAAEFLKRKGVTFPTVLDQGMQITTRYEVFGLPNSFFIDANGIVRARVVGPFSLDDMRSHLGRVRQGQDVEAPRAQSVAAASAVASSNPPPGGIAWCTWSWP